MPRKSDISENLKKSVSRGALKKDFSLTDKRLFRGALKKWFFRNRRNRIFMAPWKSDFSDTEKIPLFVPTWKSDFSVTEKNWFFIAPWLGAFSAVLKTLSSRPDRAIFRKPKTCFFVAHWISVIRKPKKYIFRGAIKNDFSEINKIAFFVPHW